MMKGMIARKNKQNSLNPTNNRKAGFVTTKDDETKRFKYKFKLRGVRYNNVIFIAINNTFRKIRGEVRLWLNKFDFKDAGIVTAVWLTNAFIEGLIVNFAVWGLLGWEFNFLTTMAWGVAVKQSLDIYWRLRINGTNTKLPQKNE